MNFHFYFILFFFVVLETQVRALHIVGKCSTTELHSQPYKEFFLWEWGLIVPTKQEFYHLSHTSSSEFFKI
jgi:hypothetical protein